MDSILDKDTDALMHWSYIYRENPVACSAALKSIEIFERENYMEKIKHIEDMVSKSGLRITLIRLSKKSDIWVVVFVSRYMTHHVLSDFRSMHINEEYFQDHFSILCMPCFRISYRIMRSGRLLMS